MANPTAVSQPTHIVVGTQPKKPRLRHIDAVRGFVMTLMALDHVRTFFHDKAILFDPVDLMQTTAGVFFTRWITHLCATVFVLLAGSGAFLWHQRGRTQAELAHYLRVRGLWLVAVELTIVKFGWTFNFSYHDVVGQVIWAIGWSMIILSTLVRFKPSTVLKIGGATILACGLLEMIPSSVFGAASPAWRLLVTGETVRLYHGFRFSSKYPIVPWAAVMAVGYGAGPVFLTDRSVRRPVWFWASAACGAAFVALRWIEMGGWRNVIFTGPAWGMVWFLDVSKYPPSLTFMLMTACLGFLVLGLADRPSGDRIGPMTVFGRVPFFFYVVHLPLIHALAILAERADRPAHLLFPMADWRYSLPWVYAIWFSVVLLMYPPCRWFADLKRRRNDTWLTFL